MKTTECINDSWPKMTRGAGCGIDEGGSMVISNEEDDGV